MFWQLVTAHLLLELSQLSEAAPDKAHSTKALQFGTTVDDYVKWYPDMSQVKKEITVCAWIKKLIPGGTRSWIHYWPISSYKYEILISDAGYYNFIHSTNVDVRSSVSVPLGTWTLQCNSWSSSSETQKVYYNGTLVGSGTISNTAPIQEGGFITLGHNGGSKRADEVFGGQMMRLNIYSKELSAAEIKEMYNGGMCSYEAERKLQEVRKITWESIFTKIKFGNVTEVDNGCPVRRTKALQFGTTLKDYVKWYPDMSQVKKEITVCAWIKKLLTGTIRSWIHYLTSPYKYEILISDAGYYNFIHYSNVDVRSSVSVPLGTWTLQCNSWSSSSGSLKVYYNGTLVGSTTVNNTAPIQEGGFITLGQESVSPQADEVFGGQMMRLNIYGKELSAAEILEMYNGGRCSYEAERKHQEVRHITWESILTQTKFGRVTEVDSGCPVPEEEESTEEEKTEEEKKEEEKTEEEKKVEEKKEEECECPEKTHSMWDVLFEETYFNKTLTKETLGQLKAVWDMLDYFVGTRINEGIINHFKQFYPKITKGCKVD